MKKIMLFVMVILSLNSFAQKNETVFVAYQKYVDDCNEIVIDTIVENGTIKMEYQPFEMDGKKCLMLVPTDTIWNKTECKEYKYSSFDDNIWLKSRSGNNKFRLGLSADCKVSTTSNYMYGSSNITQTSENITRDKICKIKKREPTFNDFWDRWCLENGYIKHSK